LENEIYPRGKVTPGLEPLAYNVYLIFCWDKWKTREYISWYRVRLH